jgi:hypothetical protein
MKKALVKGRLTATGLRGTSSSERGGFKKLITKGTFVLVIIATLFNGLPINKLPFGIQNPLTPPKDALAHYQFSPTSGELITGTETNIIGNAVPNAEPVTNTGSWKGTLADDNNH